MRSDLEVLEEPGAGEVEHGAADVDGLGRGVDGLEDARGLARYGGRFIRSSSPVSASGGAPGPGSGTSRMIRLLTSKIEGNHDGPPGLRHERVPRSRRRALVLGRGRIAERRQHGEEHTTALGGGAGGH